MRVELREVSKWFSRYRDIIPEFDYFMSVLFERPLRAIRVNTIKVSADLIYDLLCEFNFEVYRFPTLDYVLYSPSSGLGKTIFHKLGYFYLEDIVSLFPPVILLRKLGDYPIVLDLTAAPGGKCSHMAQLLLERGCGKYFVVANDVNASRLQVLIRNVERLGLTNVIITSYDCRSYPEVITDRILFDAPCSSEALVYEMKTEDLKLLISGNTIGKYSRLQIATIQRAYNLLSDGGLLLYSTCTVAPEECEAVVNYALQIGFRIERIILPGNVVRYVGGIEEWIIDGKRVKFDSDIKYTIRVYPHLNYDRYRGSIGYLYIALLRKE